MNITQVPAASRNFKASRDGNKIQYIVLHWIVGPLSAADAVFKNPNLEKPRSAHFGISGNIVHQYVKEEHTAYHAANWDYNVKSIGIEHEGGQMVNGARVVPSQATHETSAQLIATLSKKYGIPLDRAHIKKHNEIVATECPGSLNVDWIIGRAKEINTPAPPPAPTPVPGIPAVLDRRKVTVIASIGVNLRPVPNTSQKPIRALPKNTIVDVEGFVQGAVSGNPPINTWWKVAGQNAFIWSGATDVVPAWPQPQPAPPPAPTPPPPLPEEPVGTPTIPSPEPEKPREVLEAELTTLKEDYKTALQNFSDQVSHNDELNKQLVDLKRQLALSQNENANGVALKKANETLSNQIDVYKGKIDDLKKQLADAFSNAFTGWKLKEIKKGETNPLSLITLLLGFFKLKPGGQYVVGFKEDARLYNPQEFTEKGGDSQ